MKAHYQSINRPARAAAAIAAAVTVVMLFDFVGGLGESNTRHVTEASAAAIASHALIVQVASSRATPSAQ